MRLFLSWLLGENLLWRSAFPSVYSSPPLSVLSCDLYLSWSPEILSLKSDSSRLYLSSLSWWHSPKWDLAQQAGVTIGLTLLVPFHSGSLSSITWCPESWKLLLLFFNVYLFILRERGRGRGRQRGRQRIPSKLHTVSAEPHVGLKFMNREIITWAKTKSRALNRLSLPGAPKTVVPYRCGLCFFPPQRGEQIQSPVTPSWLKAEFLLL